MRWFPGAWYTIDKRDFEFRATRRTELDYARRLRKIAEHIAELLRTTAEPNALAGLLQRYADAIEPWAVSVAERMIADVSQSNERRWTEYTREMSAALREEMRNTPIGAEQHRLMREQVELIKSLPLEAAQRVHEMATEALTSGARPEEIAARIGDVTRSRANTIARTEVGRASTTLTQARAERLGSTGYVWRTARDSNVRLSHRRMEGQFVRWDDPPTLDGLTGHAGCVPNCRCIPQVVLPERF